jgi:hypothetical protein
MYFISVKFLAVYLLLYFFIYLFIAFLQSTQDT